MRRAQRELRLSFPDAESFRREYDSNLVNGGVFVPTEESFGLRELVCVELVLETTGQTARLEGEVVHHVPEGMSSLGGLPGVALQFLAASRDIRRKLQPLADSTGTRQYRPSDSGRRSEPRVPARVPARIEGAEEAISGQTRNLSCSGVLIAVPGKGVPVGEYVRLTLEHPVTGERLDVGGTVVREIDGEGDVTAVAVEFDPPANQREEMERFVENLQSAEHVRRLGGVTGSIAALGPQNLLQMFGKAAPAGTLVLRRGAEEGIVCFQGGSLCSTRLGSASGMKALVRQLAWREGTFEFHARLDRMEDSELALPLEAALMEAVRQLDEFERIDRSRLPETARVLVREGAREGLSKVEEAVLDLASAGATVQRIVDVIPEPDPEIYGALETLRDLNLIAVEN